MKLTGTDPTKTMTLRVFDKDATPPVTKPTDAILQTTTESTAALPSSSPGDIETTSASRHFAPFALIVLCALVMQF